MYQDHTVSNEHFKQCKESQVPYTPHTLWSNEGNSGRFLCITLPGVVHFYWFVMLLVFSSFSFQIQAEKCICSTRFGVINNWNALRSGSFGWLIYIAKRVKRLWPSGSVFDKHIIGRQEKGSKACHYMENQPLLLVKTWGCSSLNCLSFMQCIVYIFVF